MPDAVFFFSPIGHIRGGGKFPQEAPRQSVWARNEGFIELKKGSNFEAALDDLDGFDRIWIVAVFDRNRDWKPKVRPPFGSDRKLGVFATRAPYRPNPIALSAVELVKVEGLKVHIRNFDLLDGTPVLDIKPYIPEADSFPEAKTGWRADVPAPGNIEFSRKAARAAEFLRSGGGPDLADVARIQLTAHDFDPTRLRLEVAEKDGEWIFAYRTWRYLIRKENDTVRILAIFSGYAADELSADSGDPYQDKQLHRDFQNADLV